jgi:hypothetical protein
MDLSAELVAPCSVADLFPLVDDLGRYPEWHEIVTKAVPADDGSWAVDLRGRLGPLARTKRLRMVRTVHDVPRRVAFVRQELDGRQHSEWVLEVTIEPVELDSSLLRMHLHYGGGLFGPVLERVLREEIERSKVRLLARVGSAGS